MKNLKIRFIGLLIAAAIVIGGASALAVSLQSEDVNPDYVELIFNLPCRFGRLH